MKYEGGIRLSSVATGGSWGGAGIQGPGGDVHGMCTVHERLQCDLLRGLRAQERLASDGHVCSPHVTAVQWQYLSFALQSR